MDSAATPYHEGLLHWIWKHQYFDFQQARTTEGDAIQIIDAGQLNKSDGPDFTGAQIIVGKLRWYGDVEIHWKTSDWKAHGHHTDPNFNNVVLHVVFEDSGVAALREDQSTIPTFCLSSFMARPLRSFIETYLSPNKLPCAGHLSFISNRAFEEQIAKAHKEYFEQKVDDLLQYYDSTLPVSQAWEKMLAIALFDGLGIAHNRKPMQKLAEELINRIDTCASREELREQAFILAGFNKRHSSPLKLRWKHKGCRPGNHPRPRILQGVDALWHINTGPFEQWMHKNPAKRWDELKESITVTPSIGTERGSILFATVFLPALYSLGNLLFSEKIKSQSWVLWRDHRAQIPSSLLEPFKQTELSPSTYKKKLGAVFQLRSYCRPRNCQSCKVFKNAISS